MSLIHQCTVYFCYPSFIDFKKRVQIPDRVPFDDLMSSFHWKDSAATPGGRPGGGSVTISEFFRRILTFKKIQKTDKKISKLGETLPEGNPTVGRGREGVRAPSCHYPLKMQN